MSEHVMTVALGPVQDFIAAARRTRDLWFGSRLLSEISKAAASAMKRAGATLIFPAEEALDDRDAGVANVILVTLREGLAPAEMRRIAWEGAKTCWDRYALRVRGMAEKIINTDIWDEQVKADDVIEFYAAAVPLESEADYGRARRRVMRLLAGRKTCRDFRPAKGYPVPKSSLDGQRESVLRKRDGNDAELERAYKSLAKRLRLLPGETGEQLDAMGLVKRLAGGELEQVGKLKHAPHGYYPSVSRLAADPWLRGVAARDPEALAKLRGVCHGLVDQGITQIPEERYAGFPYEGTAVYRNRLRELGEETGEAAGTYQALADAVKALEKDFGEPDPYLAILSADGDRMGAAISGIEEWKRHRDLSKQLAAFARAARGVVESEKYRGTLVYSGGDDVLAFLPVDTCLACARELHEKFAEYLAAFAGPPTLSVGIAIGHFLEPLEDLLGYAKEAEKAAKGSPEERDGLAVHVHPRSGAPIATRAPWTQGLDEQLTTLAEMHEKEEIPDKAAYDLRELAREYEGWPRKTEQERADLDEAIRADVKRLMKRKRVARLEVWDAVLAGAQDGKEWSGGGVRRMAERVIVARRIHASERQAAGPATAEVKR